MNFHKFSWNIFDKIHSYRYIILKTLFKSSICFCCCAIYVYIEQESNCSFFLMWSMTPRTYWLTPQCGIAQSVKIIIFMSWLCIYCKLNTIYIHLWIHVGVQHSLQHLRFWDRFDFLLAEWGQTNYINAFVWQQIFLRNISSWCRQTIEVDLRQLLKWLIYKPSILALHFQYMWLSVSDKYLPVYYLTHICNICIRQISTSLLPYAYMRYLYETNIHKFIALCYFCPHACYLTPLISGNLTPNMEIWRIHLYRAKTFVRGPHFSIVEISDFRWDARYLILTKTLGCRNTSAHIRPNSIAATLSQLRFTWLS